MRPNERPTPADALAPDAVIDRLVAELAAAVGTDARGAAANDDPALRLVAERLEQLRAAPADAAGPAPARRRLAPRLPPANGDDPPADATLTEDQVEHHARATIAVAAVSNDDRMRAPPRPSSRLGLPDAEDPDAVILAAARDMDYRVRWLPDGAAATRASHRKARRSPHAIWLLRWVLVPLATCGAALLPLELTPRVSELAPPEATEVQVSMAAAEPAEPTTPFLLQNRRTVRTVRVDATGRFLPPMRID